MITAVVGGQFGSEGKGLVVGEIATDYGVHVRVGAANAGHTLYTTDPDTGELEKHVMQQLPCAAYANPDADLVIGPGALISQHIFYKELERWAEWRAQRGYPKKRAIVDPRAHVITDAQIKREQESDLAERIGSTSTKAKEGIGAAAADRVMRESRCETAGDFYHDEHECRLDICIANENIELRDTTHIANDLQRRVMLEGTQGTGLSLTTGFFPYVTSRNTTAAGLAADAGAAPTHIDRVILVCRTFPIRVAGNSGPFHHGSEEIGWEDVGIDPENERTTVTKLVRRVATFSIEQVYEAVRLNGATEIALTFADYLDPEVYGKIGPFLSEEAPNTSNLIREIERTCDVPVTFIGTGPHSTMRKRSLLI